MSINYSAVKSYRIYVNYDNDNQVYILPVNPADISITYKGETQSVQIDRFGEVLHKGRRDAAVIKFECILPAYYDQYVCSCPKSDFKTPDKWVSWLKQLEEADKPCHFVLTKSPLNVNIYADITSFQPKESGGDPGTLTYTLELKEHREPIVRTLKKVGKKSSKSSKKKRTSNKSSKKKYKVTASALHLRTGPNATIIGLMPRGTVVTTDGKKNGNWLHVLYGKKWGYAYMSYLKKC